MGQIKIASFNAEWMYSIFGAKWKKWVPGTIPETFHETKIGDIKLEAIGDVPGLCRRIAGVIKDMDAEIIAVLEAPPRQDQMELFVERFLNDDYVVHYSNENQQAICALVRKSIAAHVTSWVPALPNIDRIWFDITCYPWGQIAKDSVMDHKFARRPLLLTYTTPTGEMLGLMALHTKSKYSKLKNKSQWENRDPEAVFDALNARVKLSAEIARVRKFLTDELTLPMGIKSLIVMGDLNDGPYADLMEQEFLIHNIVDELVGTLLDPDKYFEHAMTPTTLRTAATTHFPDPLQDGKMVDELIDHILVSPAIWQNSGTFRIQTNSCQVEAQAYNNHNEDDDAHPQRDKRPSDHKPISVVIEY